MSELLEECVERAIPPGRPHDTKGTHQVYLNLEDIDEKINVKKTPKKTHENKVNENNFCNVMKASYRTTQMTCKYAQNKGTFPFK